MCIYVHMVKVISLSDEAYNALSNIKKDKSFSTLVLDLLDQLKLRKTQQEFFAAKKSKPNSQKTAAWENIKQEIHNRT